MKALSRRWFLGPTSLLTSTILTFSLLGSFSLSFVAAPSVWAADNAKEYKEVVNKAVDFLKSQGQAADGSFSGAASVGPTALVVSSLLSVDVPLTDPVLVKSLAFLEKNVQPDGGIYAAQSRHKNYETCIAIVALSKANKNGKYEKLIANADKFIKGLQWDEGEGKNPSDMEYGGAGYDSKGRPDLSNTSFLIEAIRSAGNDADDEAIQRALTFVTRCQNLETEKNNSPQAAKVNDGGFFYTIAGGGESKAGDGANGGLRSYGSMTYAGLKSMIYAGVEKDDPRVKAATEFLRKYYDLETNPGMGSSGLYYYYHTMAKALDALGEEEFADASGSKHPWRAELFAKLKQSQQSNGSWVNTDSRWMEGDPNLVTAYALLALSYTQK